MDCKPYGEQLPALVRSVTFTTENPTEKSMNFLIAGRLWLPRASGYDAGHRGAPADRRKRVSTGNGFPQSSSVFSQALRPVDKGPVPRASRRRLAYANPLSLSQVSPQLLVL